MKNKKLKKRIVKVGSRSVQEGWYEIYMLLLACSAKNHTSAKKALMKFFNIDKNDRDHYPKILAIHLICSIYHTPKITIDLDSIIKEVKRRMKDGT